MISIVLCGVLLIVELVFVYVWYCKATMSHTGKLLATLAPLTLMICLVDLVLVNSLTINGFTYFFLLQASYVLIGAAIAFLIAFGIVVLSDVVQKGRVGESAENETK